MSSETANAEQAAYWDGSQGAHWVEFEDRYDEMLAPFTDRLLGAAAISGADRVLDIGCGFGPTTLAAARIAKEVVGVDLSGALLSLARERADLQGLTNVTFEKADVQVHDFASPDFDVAISRFGVMFFDDPVAAFANIASALRPGGRLAFVAWANVLDNDWVAVPGAAAAQFVELPSSDPLAPGPFALENPERTKTILVDAGFEDVNFDPVYEKLSLGSDPTDATEFFRHTGFAERVLADADAETVDRVAQAVKQTFANYATPGGVKLGSKAWIVTCRRA